MSGQPTTNTQQAGDIIVTAQKRPENVQDVPKAVEVLSQARLQTAGVTDLQDLNRVSPSIQGVSAFPFTPPAIRGISSFAYSIGVQAQTGVVLDDVPQPSFATLANELSDVERVEVLPGPQSTLSGRNAAGGLINIVTRSPTSLLEGNLTAEQTTDRQSRVAGYISGPLTKNLGFSISGFYDKWSGPDKNVQTGRYVNGFDQRGVRAKLRWQIGDNFTATLTGYYTDAFFRRTPLIGGGAYVAAANDAGSVLLPGATMADLHPGEVIGPYNTTLSSPDESIARNSSRGGSLRFDYDSAIGTFSSITSYLHGHQPRTDQVLGYAYPPSPDPLAFTDTDVKYVTQEMRLSSNRTSGPFQYLFGEIYTDTDNFEPYYRPTLFSVLWDRDADLRSLAFYGRLTYEFLPKTYLTGGMRYQHDDQSYRFIFVDGTAPTSRGENTYGFVTEEASLRHEFTPDIKAYFTFANAQTGRAYDLEDNGDAAVGTLQPLPSEKVRNYEVGLKTQWFDRRLTINLSLFEANYRNYQVQATAPLTSPDQVPVIRLFAIGKVRNKGAELEADFRANSRLDFGATASYLKATIVSYPGAQCYTGQTAAQGCVDDAQDLSGVSLPGTSKFRATSTLNYILPLPSLPFDGTFSAFYRFQTKTRYDLFGDPSTVQKAFGILNLSVGVRSHDSRYSAEIFVNNAANKHYYAGLGQDTLSPGYALTASYARDFARYAGLRLSGKF